MSLGIVTLNPEGIVLSADSRQTYTNLAKTNRIGTDNAKKLYQLTDHAALVVAGRAFALDEKKQIKGIGWFIERFKNEILSKDDPAKPRPIKDLAEALIEYLSRKGIDGLSVIIAGYTMDDIGKAYLFNVPGSLNEDLSRDTDTGGFLRIGQQEVVTRIMNGWGMDIFGLDFVKKAQEGGVDVGTELNKVSYIVNWSAITIQDAIDFCVLMTRITESIQRFSDGTRLNPGDTPGVGGPIDIAIITPRGFEWLARKELKIND